MQQALRPLLKGASDCFAKKQYRKAKSIYNQILDLDTGKVPNTAALYGLAKVAAANNKQRNDVYNQMEAVELYHFEEQT